MWRDSEKAPSLTIIICTYNRAELLRSCLQSLTQQTVESSCFSVLVVDNNCTDHTSDVADAFSSALPFLKVCNEPQQGLSHARNCGLRKADSKWVAFLDDDAVARKNWVERIFNMIMNHPYDAFGGHYLPWYRDGKVDWYLDRYATDRSWMPYSEISELHDRCFSGGNAVYRRELAITAGGFPGHLGMQGDQLGYGEENALQYAIRRLGYRTGIDPKMNIDHLVPLHKQKLAWFLNRRCSEGRIHLWQGKTKPTVVSVLWLFVQFAGLDLRNFMRGLWRMLLGEYKIQNLYVDTVPELCFQWQVFLSLFDSRD